MDRDDRKLDAASQALLVVGSWDTVRHVTSHTSQAHSHTRSAIQYPTIRTLPNSREQTLACVHDLESGMTIDHDPKGSGVELERGQG